MKTALISLPLNNILTYSIFTNLHGYWNPPSIVLEFCCSSCTIEYVNDTDYNMKKEIILNSYNECIRQHYREFVY